MAILQSTVWPSCYNFFALTNTAYHIANNSGIKALFFKTNRNGISIFAVHPCGYTNFAIISSGGNLQAADSFFPFILGFDIVTTFMVLTCIQMRKGKCCKKKNPLIGITTAKQKVVKQMRLAL